MSKTKRELQLQREIEMKLRKNTSNQIVEVTKIINQGGGGGGGGIPEAPIDGNYYARKDGSWQQVISGGGGGGGGFSYMPGGW